MIKSLTLLTRMAGLTHEEFMRHWVEIHAPLARKVPGIRRYVHRLARGQALYADGALFIGQVKTFTTEELVVMG